MFDLELMSGDQAMDVVMREEAALIQSAISGLNRNYAVVYLDAKGDLQRFSFSGKPSGLVDKLLELGVDPRRDEQGRYISALGRSWMEPGEGRLSEASDTKMLAHLKAYVDELEAKEATSKVKAVAQATTE